MIFLILLLCIIATKGEIRSGEIVACEFNGFSENRFPLSQFNNCTHVICSYFSIYSFYVFLKAPDDPMFGEIKDDIRKLPDMKKVNPHMKILLEIKDDGLGSWGEGSNSLSSNASRFLVENNLDGVVVDSKVDKDSNKESEVQIAKKIKEDMSKHNLLFLLKMPVRFSAYYPISETREIIDYFILSSSLREKLDPYTSPFNPLRSKNASIPTIENSVKYMLDQGVSSSKVLIPLTFGGAYSSVFEKSKGEFGEKVDGYTIPLGYDRICPHLKNGTRYWDRDSETPLVAFENTVCFGRSRCNGTYTIVSYDDSASIVKKVQYGKNLQLGGFYIEYLDEDDVEGKCGGGNRPLMNAAIAEIRRPMPSGTVTDPAP